MNLQSIDRNLFDLISQTPNTEHFRPEGRKPAQADSDYGVYESQRKEKLPSSESRVLFRPEGMAMTDRPTVERPNAIYEKDLPGLRRVAIPAAQYLVEHGLLMDEMRITANYVDIVTPEAGTPFTNEDQDEIFPPSLKDPPQKPVTDSDYGVYEKDLPELRRLAVPLARFLIEHGMLMGKVVIQTHRVDVYADEAGSPFTDEEEAEIFQE